MKKEFSSKIASLIFSILVICFVVAFYALGWTEPAVVPPGGNVPAPINVGIADQFKSGKIGAATDGIDPNYGLTVGSGINLLGIKSAGNSWFEGRLNVLGNLAVAGSFVPGKQLDVGGDIRLRGDTATLNFYRSTNPTDIAYLKYNEANQTLDVAANSKAVRFLNQPGWLESMRITAGGNVGIGTVAPAAKLEINGQIKITGGGPGAGKVLTSDVSGLASWQSPVIGSLQCTTRTNSAVVDYNATVSASCLAGEVVTGGGCAQPPGSPWEDYWQAFYISGNSYVCHTRANVPTNITAYVQCCRVQ